MLLLPKIGIGECSSQARDGCGTCDLVSRVLAVDKVWFGVAVVVEYTPKFMRSLWVTYVL